MCVASNHSLKTPMRNIVLVGFMGAGKTTVGCLLAAELGLDFVDTDEMIERKAGLSVSEIFTRFGEAGFRALEANVVKEQADRCGLVIATGGGALSNTHSLRTLHEGCLMVWLKAPLEHLLRRAVQQGNRPLLAGEEALAKARALYESRVPLYATAHLIVNADQSPEQVSKTITSFWRLAQNGGMQLQRIPVRLQERSYEVTVGAGALDLLPQLLENAGVGSSMQRKRALLVSDSTVAPLYSQRVLDTLQSAGWQTTLYAMDAGEGHKHLDTLRGVYAACIAAHLDRSSPLMALGGGVVGDVTGFAAATFLRGVPFVQLPTTLLAQVDASVGGKVAVNLPEGKNLIGAFYQPRAVVADVSTLTSLPRRELVSGLCEVIKHGLIADSDLFAYIERHLGEILAYDPAALQVCVGRSCEIKGAVVESDERESSQREVLNFGHTVGHAVETVSGYGSYAHGEAVAIGMVTAAKLSLPLGFRDEDLQRLVFLLRRSGLPVNAPQLSPHTLVAAMRHDKKARGDSIRFALLPSMGNALAGKGVDEDQILSALEWQNGL